MVQICYMTKETVYLRQWPHWSGQRLGRHLSDIGFFGDRSSLVTLHTLSTLQKVPGVVPARALTVNCGTRIDSWGSCGRKTRPEPGSCIQGFCVISKFWILMGRGRGELRRAAQLLFRLVKCWELRGKGLFSVRGYMYRVSERSSYFHSNLRSLKHQLGEDDCLLGCCTV
jgi:hypothetical protein